MAFTRLTSDLAIIAALADLPNATSGLTPAQLKAKFDEASGLIKTYLNSTFAAELESTTAGDSGLYNIGMSTINGYTNPQLFLQYIYDAIGGISPGPQSVMRQAIINGNFAVNQRVVSGSVILAAGAYGHDRWKAGSSGCTYTFSTVENVTTITISAGSLIQVVEGRNLFTGSYTLSWIGTAQGKIGAGSYGTSGVTGAVTGGTNLSIEFNSGTLSKVQFNVGTTSLPNQPRGFAEELALCQRYYWKTFNYDVAPSTGQGAAGGLTYRAHVAGATNDGIYVKYPVPMRVFPTVTFYNISSANNKWRNVNLSADSATAAPNAIGDANVFVDNPQVSGDAVGHLLIVHMTADAEL